MAVKVFHHLQDLKNWVRETRTAGKSIGLVPTMGALHAGHLSLVEKSLEKTDRTVVSIFVNPTQFGPQEDFAKYPRTLEKDLAALESVAGDREMVVLAPSATEMYPAGFETFIEVGGAAKPLEGSCRPGHFRGVATVVLKLFLLTECDVAFFGQKDFQQVQVIRQMVRDLNVPVEIGMCPIVREADGLAMSSRNRYLSPEARQRALALSQSLHQAKQHLRQGIREVSVLEAEMRKILESHPNHQVDYVAIVHPETLLPQSEKIVFPVAFLLAVRVDETRLIDNLLVESETEI
ncbi:MAG: pantoate--beta-alanine ligase [Planctomycetia bacterium]|nr:pantoate--beta-alanine ligase [Planctomycetia bacterium]